MEEEGEVCLVFQTEWEFGALGTKCGTNVSSDECGMIFWKSLFSVEVGRNLLCLAGEGALVGRSTGGVHCRRRTGPGLCFGSIGVAAIALPD